MMWRVADDDRFRWMSNDLTQNITAVAALALAAATFAWTVYINSGQQELQEKMAGVQDAQATLQEKQVQMQEESVGLQREALAASGVQITFSDIQVRTSAIQQNGELKVDDFQSGEVPITEWAQADSRWILAKVGNTGEKPAILAEHGLGVTADGYIPGPASSQSCLDSATTQWSSDFCKTPLNPGETRELGFTVDYELLRNLDEQTRLAGVQFCASADPYPNQCGRNDALILPAIDLGP